jgi:hypothetical protein
VILPQILIEERNPTTPQANTMESLTLRTSPATASPLQRRIPRPRATSVRASASAGEPDLSVCVNGLKMPNPFVIGSGPPGTNYTVMKRAFDEGWGGVIAKTVSHPLSDLAAALIALACVAAKLASISASKLVAVTVRVGRICRLRSKNSVLDYLDHVKY